MRNNQQHPHLGSDGVRMMRQHLGIGGRVIYVISQFYETGRCACDLVGFPQRNEEEKLRVYDFRCATCTGLCAGSIFREDFEGFKGLQLRVHVAFSGSGFFCMNIFKKFV